jgi:enamine deaminase RidA (YjgF/YER057c/UK114 family)
MRILQPAEWSKPRGFSHGVEVDGPGKWIVLAGQTGGDEKGEYAPDMAAQVGTALKRIVKLLGEAGAGPEHIVRLTWYLTSRSEYEAAGPGIGAAWKETLGRNFPAIDIALYRRAGRRPGQGRNRSHRLRAQGLVPKALVPKAPPDIHKDRALSTSGAPEKGQRIP